MDMDVYVYLMDCHSLVGPLFVCEGKGREMVERQTD